jgi:hypothetical protein
MPELKRNYRLRNWAALIILAGVAVFMYGLIMFKIAHSGF